MRRTMLAAASALMLGLATTGCASTPDSGDAAPTRAIVEVQNYNPLLVTIDAVSVGEDFRLGQVETSGTETFVIPQSVNEFDLRILVDPIGSSDTYLSDEIVAGRGDIVRVEVGATLDLTTVTVY